MRTFVASPVGILRVPLNDLVADMVGSSGDENGVEST